MNKIKRFFLKKQKEKEYKKYIFQHKINIVKAMQEMLECEDLEYLIYDEKILEPLWIRVLEHDDSKYEKEEFDAYRRYYYPIDEQEKEESKEDFKKAWEHHWKNNDHHWECRQNWDDKDFNIETELACLENILDWMAMGYQFNNRPYQYYEKNKDKIKLPPKQKAFIEKIIYEGIDKERK